MQEGIAKATKLRDGSITMAFERKAKGKVTFSLHQHTKAETRFVIVHVTFINWTYLIGASERSSSVGYQRACDHFL